jgi:hypothetical protein
MVSEFELFHTLRSVINMEQEVNLPYGILISHKGPHYTVDFSVIRPHEKSEELGALFHFSIVTNSKVAVDFDAPLSTLEIDVLSIGRERIIQFCFGSYFLRLCTVNGAITYIHVNGIADYQRHFGSDS